MKTLIITNYLGEKSGWGSYSMSLVEQLTKNGIKVVVICNKKNEKYDDIVQVEILPNPLSFKRNYFLAPLYVFKIWTVLKKKKIDFVHCLVEPYAFIAYLTSKIFRTRYFITIHGSYGVKTLRSIFYGFFQIIAYKNAHVVICVSNYTKRRVLEYKKLTNFAVIPNGVDICSPKSKIFNNQQKEDIILGVGALKQRKGFDVMVKALGIVIRTIPNIKYCIVGSPEDYKYLIYIRKLIENLNLENNIVLFGKVSDNKLKEFYKKSKVFALTPLSSKFDFEGFGLVYLEANKYGLPVVGSYDNGGEEAIKDGYSGFLAKANNPEDTADKLIKILSSKELYEKLSQNAISWSQEMSWDNVFEKYLEVYGSQKKYYYFN